MRGGRSYAPDLRALLQVAAGRERVQRFAEEGDAGEAPDRHDGAPAAPGVLGLLSGALSVGLVLGLLRNVIDPELGVNIVDLGLGYDVTIDEQTGEVEIEMTLTTPGCPLSGYMDDQIRAQLAQLPQARHVSIELVWDPAWAPHMMSAAARGTLGLAMSYLWSRRSSASTTALLCSRSRAA